MSVISKLSYPVLLVLLATSYVQYAAVAAETTPKPESAPTPTQKIYHLYNIHANGSGNKLLLPTDIAINGSRLYIVDSGNHRIGVYRTNGKHLFSFGSKGDIAGKFSSPVGIDAGADGMLYVADTGNHRIQIFDKDGKYTDEIKLSINGTHIRPIDVAVDANSGRIYVTGNNNHQVMVYDRNKKLVRTWGGNGADTGKFRYPATLAITANSDVAVVDVLNTRAQLFKQDGTYLAQMGEWGVLPGQLFRPKGIALDRKGHVYISDSYMNMIQVFDDSGRFLRLLKTHKSEHGLTTPAGIALDDKHLYVVEMLKNRVSVFRMD